jgi:sec-independent protein translocase protein TatA
MLSVPDMAIIGALALIFFGPEQLPRVAKRVGHVVRDVQNTSQAFIREMERAAEEHEVYADEHDAEPDADRHPGPGAPNDEHGH